MILLTSPILSDPLYPTQEWIFQQINIIPVWQKNIFGTGVRVRINDDGVDGSIAELAGRFDQNSSCEDFAPMIVEDDHGTGVASIVGGVGNNGECGVGVAPGVIISSCNAFAKEAVQVFSDFDYKLDQFDISHNSIGVPACSSSDDEITIRRRLQNCPFVDADASPCQVCNFNATPSASCEQSIIAHCQAAFFRDEVACLDFLELLIGTNTCNYNQIPESMLQAISQGIARGRNGKGAIYVFASGNDFQIGDDVNFGGLTNSRLTITVGAVGKDELHASYSTPGAALVVSAPGGDAENLSNHVTAMIGGGCSGVSVGTSFAAPVVTGVIALMLEVNPELTWRDVQGILAETSRTITADTDDSSRVTNNAGFTHSNLYGFGIVDANASVSAAQSWTLYCPERFVNVESGPLNISIIEDEDATAVAHTITVDESKADDDFVVEAVVVLLDIQHFSRGDLEIILTSPGGTPSILHPGKRPENTQTNERWKLMSVRNWGESAVGEWTLSIRDLRQGDLTDCVDAPFRTNYLGTDVDCVYLSEQGLCANGVPDPNTFGTGEMMDLLNFQYGGFTMEDACCACGGGFTTNDYEDQLRQWRLVIYGRSKTCDDEVGNLTTTASLLPSNVTSFTPSSAPTILPVNASRPSKAPTVSINVKEEPTPEAEVDPQKRLTTILASVTAVILACCCIFATLRTSKGSEGNRFSNTKARAEAGRPEGGFENVNGEIA